MRASAVHHQRGDRFQTEHQHIAAHQMAEESAHIGMVTDVSHPWMNPNGSTKPMKPIHSPRNPARSAGRNLALAFLQLAALEVAPAGSPGCANSAKTA